MSTKSVATEIVQHMTERGQWLCFAESCTAGGVPEIVTPIPGASKMFLGGFTVYADHAIAAMTGTSLSQIQKWGPVSMETTKCLAESALRQMNADLCIATTGYLGPFEDELPEHHVGYVVVVSRHGLREAVLHLDGRREANRQAMLTSAFNETLALLKDGEDEPTVSLSRLR